LLLLLIFSDRLQVSRSRRLFQRTIGDLRRVENLRTLAEKMIFGLKTLFWKLDVVPRTVVDEVLSYLREESFAGVYATILEWYAKHKGKP
jgi:hypothetical protein